MIFGKKMCKVVSIRGSDRFPGLGTERFTQVFGGLSAHRGSPDEGGVAGPPVVASKITVGATDAVYLVPHQTDLCKMAL